MDLRWGSGQSAVEARKFCRDIVPLVESADLWPVPSVRDAHDEVGALEEWTLRTSAGLAKANPRVFSEPESRVAP